MKQIFKNMKRHRLTEDDVVTSQQYDPILQKSKIECPAVRDKNPPFEYRDGAKFGLTGQQVLVRLFPDSAGNNIGYSVLYNNQGSLYSRKTDLSYKPLYINNTLQKDGPITACNDVLQSVRYELQMNTNQTSFVDDYINKNKNFTKNKPSQQQLTAKEFIPVDLHTIRKDLFTVPGEYFIYKRAGIQNTKIDLFANYQDKMTAAGYTFEEPTNDLLRANGVPLSQILGGTAGQEVINLAKQNNVTVPTVYPLSATGDQKRQECRTYIQVLHKALKGKTRDAEVIRMLGNADQLTKVKDRVLWCNDNMNFVGGMFGVGDKLKEIMSTSTRDNRFGLDGYQSTVRENSNRLKSLIRENLEKVMMEKKKSLLQEKKIIGGRFSIISENRNVKTKKQVVKVIDELISEAHYLTKQGYDTKLINENLLDMFSGIFGGGIGKTITGTIKERVIEFLLSKLGLDPNGFFGLALSTAIGNVALGDVPKLISDCGFTTKLIAKTIAEIGVRKLQQKTGFENFLSDAVRNAIVDTLDQSSLAQNIENAISDFICPLMSGVKSKVENMTDTMKKGALQMT